MDKDHHKALIKAADMLAEAQGHSLSCRFINCTCGKAERIAELLGEYMRLRRKGDDARARRK